MVATLSLCFMYVKCIVKWLSHLTNVQNVQISLGLEFELSKTTPIRIYNRRKFVDSFQKTTFHSQYFDIELIF